MIFPFLQKQGRTATFPRIALAILASVGAGSMPRGVGAQAEAPYFLAVRISPEARVAVEQGTTFVRLRQGVWQSFTVCIENEAQVTAVPRLFSPNAPVAKDRDHWLDIALDSPMKRLTGRRREYRTLRLRSRDTGLREAMFQFDVGQGTQDLGFRGQVSVVFQCLPNNKSR